MFLFWLLISLILILYRFLSYLLCYEAVSYTHLHNIEARDLFNAVLADINCFADMAVNDEKAVRAIEKDVYKRQQIKNDEVILKGEIPARCIHEYRNDLTCFTNGQGVCLT